MNRKRHIKAIASKVLTIVYFTVFAVTPSFAKDYSTSTGELSNKDFYRAVTCRAQPSKPCVEKMLKWPRVLQKQITVGVVQFQPGTTLEKSKLIQKSARAAVSRVNAVKSGIRMTFLSGPLAKNALIKIYVVTPSGENGVIQNVNFKGLNGQKTKNARTAILAIGNKIFSTGIAINNTVSKKRLQSIVLEEITQSTGLAWDIKNPFYEKVSIFSQTGSDAIKNLKGQDAMALRMHYPN